MLAALVRGQWVRLCTAACQRGVRTAGVLQVPESDQASVAAHPRLKTLTVAQCSQLVKPSVHLCNSPGLFKCWIPLSAPRTFLGLDDVLPLFCPALACSGLRDSTGSTFVYFRGRKPSATGIAPWRGADMAVLLTSVPGTSVQCAVVPARDRNGEHWPNSCMCWTV